MSHEPGGVARLRQAFSSLEADLRRHSGCLLPGIGASSFAMALLISEPGDPAESPFLRLLRRNLVESETGFDQSDARLLAALREWVGVSSGELVTSANWLKIAIEQYPFRLFVAIDPGEWQRDGASPLDARFWHPLPASLRFFRRRICWVDANDLCDTIGKITGAVATDRAKSAAEQLLEHLRLRWLRHLATDFTGFGEDGENLVLHILVDLKDEDTERVESLDPPQSVPVVWRDSKGKGASKAQRGHFVLDLHQLMATSGSASADDKLAELGLAQSDLSEGARFVMFRRHQLVFNLANGRWSADPSVFPKTEPAIAERLAASSWFQQVVTGAGRVFSLLDAVLLSGADASSAILAELGEQGAVRIGIADERFQEWLWDRRGACLPERERGWVIAQGVLPVFVDGAGRHGQPPYTGSPHGVFEKADEGYTLSLDPTFGTPEGLDRLWPTARRGLDALIVHQGLLDKRFMDDKSKQRLTRELLAMKDAVPLVAVTSGRGVPENLPTGCRFLPYASVEGAMHGPYFEKPILWRALWSA